jgi:hypothetical protein
MDDESPVSLHAQRLIQALKDCGGWCTRAQLAKQLGKLKLNYGDDVMLGVLVEQKKVERTEESRSGGIAFKVYYRIAK